MVSVVCMHCICISQKAPPFQPYLVVETILSGLFQNPDFFFSFLSLAWLCLFLVGFLSFPFFPLGIPMPCDYGVVVGPCRPRSRYFHFYNPPFPNSRQRIPMYTTPWTRGWFGMRELCLRWHFAIAPPSTLSYVRPFC